MVHILQAWHVGVLSLQESDSDGLHLHLRSRVLNITTVHANALAIGTIWYPMSITFATSTVRQVAGSRATAPEVVDF